MYEKNVSVCSDLLSNEWIEKVILSSADEIEMTLATKKANGFVSSGVIHFNLAKTFELKKFGVYNCDQKAKFNKPVSFNQASFVLGQDTIEGKIKVVNLAINGRMTYSSNNFTIDESA